MPAPSIRAVCRREGDRASHSLESFITHIDWIERLTQGKGYTQVDGAIAVIKELTVHLNNVVTELRSNF